MCSGFFYFLLGHEIVPGIVFSTGQDRLPGGSGSGYFVFLFDFQKNLFAINLGCFRSFDSQTNILSFYFYNGNFHIVINLDAFTDAFTNFSREN